MERRFCDFRERGESEVKQGFFHGFGLDSWMEQMYRNDGIISEWVTDSVAIVERGDGTIVKVPVENIKLYGKEEK